MLLPNTQRSAIQLCVAPESIIIGKSSPQTSALIHNNLPFVLALFISLSQDDADVLFGASLSALVNDALASFPTYSLEHGG